jgi:hypothetical protein
MIMENAGKTVSQYREAYDEFGDLHCLDEQPGEACDLPGWPQFEDYGFSYRTNYTTPLPWEEVKQQIDSNWPFAFAQRDLETIGGSHVVVAIGYSDGAAERDVWYIDPHQRGDPLYMPYDDYADPQVHLLDFYEIQRRGSDDAKH